MAEKQKSNKLIVVVIILMVILLAAAGVIIVMLAKGGDNTSSEIYNSETGFGYELNAEVLTSGDKAFSQTEGVAIKFKTVARSADGINFSCQIGNSTANALDMYIDIYENTDFSEEGRIYVSGLMRPGEGITSFKALKQMPSGNYDVVLIPTLIEDDHKTIHAQSSVALTLMVD